MLEVFEFFVAIAEIAGIFIGFGALISITSPDEIEPSQLQRLRGLVTVGLMVIVVALIPVGLSLYGVTGHILWFICSLVYFSANWAMIIWSFQKATNREMMTKEFRTRPVITTLFWLLLEVPLQVPLILTMLGLFPDLEPALYTTALLFHLFEAVFVLAQIVYSQVEPTSAEGSKPPSKRKHRHIIH